MMERKRLWAAALVSAAAVIMVLVHGLPAGEQEAQEEMVAILTPASDEWPADDGASLGEGIWDAPVPLAGAPGEGEDPYLDQLVALVNEERGKAGVAPLEISGPVCAAASIRADEIVTSFSHTRPDGSPYKTVLSQAGIGYRNCGENVAYGYRTPEEVMAGWMASEGHRANILEERYSSIGIGYRKGRDGLTYWVQLFLLGSDMGE